LPPFASWIKTNIWVLQKTNGLKDAVKNIEKISITVKTINQIDRCLAN